MQMRTTFAVFSTLLALPSLASLARADTLQSALSQPLVETSHDVDITVAEGVATYRVQRSFANRGDVADEASLDIDLPFGGGVTGLRIRARDTWYDGDLMEASAAAKLYQELTGFGPFPAKDPALLQWVWPDKVHLQVFPVLPGKTSTVEYTLTVPTRYKDGRYHVSYPRFPGAGLAQPEFVVHGEAKFDGGPAVAAGARFRLPPPAPLPAWDGVVERASSAAYIVSRTDVADVERARGELRAASIDLDLSHTFRGDLRVELVTPQGKSIVLHDRTDGNKSDLKARFPLTLPPGTTAVGPWRLVISDHAPRDVGTLNRWTLNLDVGKPAPFVASVAGPLFIADAPEGAEDRGLIAIEVGAPAIDTVAARLGRVVASPAHSFLRLDLDAAPTLRPLPRRASVVFVVDASRSVGDEGVATQLAVARAFLAHVPDAVFEIVVFRRFATRVTGRFEPAARWGAVVDGARRDHKLDLGNGSALDLGVVAALDALRRRPGPRRVVVLSDAELRGRFDTAAVLPRLRALPADTVVHVALPALHASDETTEKRDDDHALSPLAAAGHGVLLHLTGVAGADSKRLAPAVLGLVRPIRIDRFQVSGADGLVQGDDPLVEGAAVRVMTALPEAPRRVTLEGKIWAEPFRRVVDVTAPFSKATAAFVFAENQHDKLDDKEQMAVAMFGQVVSPVTSYLAAEPGVRPSPIGLHRTTGTGIGSGFGAGRGHLAGRVAGAARTRPVPDTYLQPGVDACVARHGKPRTPIQLALETTGDEIVDVLLETPRSPVADCVVEAAWSAHLSEAFQSWGRQQYTLRY